MRTRSMIVGLLGALAALFVAAPPQAPLAAESPCHIEGVDRVVVVGDIHGAYDRFVEILRTTGLLDAQLHWAGGRAHLVQTGDVVDRGPDSLKALDLLSRLEGEAHRAGGAVHPMLGNHEVMRLLGDLRYVAPGEYAVFVTSKSERIRQEFVESIRGADAEQLTKNTPLGQVEMRIAFGREGKYGMWLRKQPAVVKINGILMTHGGISPDVAAMSCDAINTAVHREITDDLEKTRQAPDKTLSAGADGPLWYRGLAQEPETFAAKVDEILSKQEAQAIVIAHTVMPDGRILARFDGKVFLIDTGMQQQYQPAGRASALEIQNGSFTAIYLDRRDVIPRQTAAVVEPVAAPVPR